MENQTTVDSQPTERPKSQLDRDIENFNRQQRELHGKLSDHQDGTNGRTNGPSSQTTDSCGAKCTKCFTKFCLSFRLCSDCCHEECSYCCKLCWSGDGGDGDGIGAMTFIFDTNGGGDDCGHDGGGGDCDCGDWTDKCTTICINKQILGIRCWTLVLWSEPIDHGRESTSVCLWITLDRTQRAFSTSIRLRIDVEIFVRFSTLFRRWFDIESTSKLQGRRRIDVDISTVFYLASKRRRKSVEKSTSKFRLARWGEYFCLSACELHWTGAFSINLGVSRHTDSVRLFSSYHGQFTLYLNSPIIPIHSLIPQLSFFNHMMDFGTRSWVIIALCGSLCVRWHAQSLCSLGDISETPLEY